MSTSAFQGRIQFDEADHSDDSPLSDDVGRVLANNLLHFADGAGQVRAAWAAPTPSLAPSGVVDYLTVKTLGDTDDQGVPWVIWVGGVFVPVCHNDGRPYPMRVGLSGYSPSGASVTFSLVYAAAVPSVHAALAGQTDALVSLYTTTSTTDGVITGSKTLISPTRDDALAGVDELATVDAIGGDHEGIAVPLMMLSVWASTADYTNLPRLTGLYAAEYVGT